MGGFSPLLQTLILTLTLAFIPLLAAEDLYRLVYKGCASSRGGAVAPPAVAALSSTLIAQAATSKFYKTTSSAAGQPVLGLFQCRGDLSGGACASCVARALPAWAEQCGPTAAAARVQLAGCYALYQVSGFPQVSGTQLLFKTCAASGGGGGFEENRDTALSTVQGGVAAGGGFDATTYGGVYALAQCEGDLSGADCGECVAQAVQKAEVECGGAASAQVFLDKCYISYSYYPNGVPRGGGGGGGGFGGGGGGGGGGGQQTGKTVAIVVGGAAAVGFLIICLLFANSLRKKKDDY